METDFITLTRYVLDEYSKNPGIPTNLAQLLSSITTCIKAISNVVEKGGILEIYNLADPGSRVNVKQQTLDTVCNNLFVNTLKKSFTTCLMVSKEEAGLVEVDMKDQGQYVVCFDPLNGSRSIDIVGTLGSTFCIYNKLPDPLPDSCTVGVPKRNVWPTLQDALQTGRNIVAAGYALYGSTTGLVVSIGKGVHAFTLDSSIGEFILSDLFLKIPQRGNIYSINEGYASQWDDAISQYVYQKKFPRFNKPYQARYDGSMVADIHRTLKYGGIFMYPAMKTQPKGKCRLVYECNPLAFIIEEAGGKASNGVMPIMDIKPESIHDSTPIFIGSPNDVDDVLLLIKESTMYAKN